MINAIDHALEILEQNKPKIKQEKDLREAILKYYQEDLRDIAMLYVTMPVTQVSVERLFSALKLLKSDLRNRLNDDIIADILLMRSNL